MDILLTAAGKKRSLEFWCPSGNRCDKDSFLRSIPPLYYQITAVRFWKECDQDNSAPGKTRSPKGTTSTVVFREDATTAVGGGRAEKENAGRGGGGGVMVMVSDGRPDRLQDTGSSDHRRARRGGSLTCPSKGDGDPPSCVVSGDTAAVQCTNGEEQGSAASRVVIRAPSPASSLASGVGVKAAAGRLWGDRVTEGPLPPERQGGRGKGLGWKVKAGRRKGGKLGSWGQRKARREMELADWLETNTNLVNVSPW